ncbi:hypothetical protein BDV41DRAFT_559390 [Aspergillus transmontanensis]|uniref:Uncharacterized protein n=1 Tax=Aspergillus transmontanensis TaxID=1034304 RepID=A0A5N6VCY6_9EURO|nr:hypothetical protein BDV41DRAFT_559390 [Aspergillus transmontanensis]
MKNFRLLPLQIIITIIIQIILTTIETTISTAAVMIEVRAIIEGYPSFSLPLSVVLIFSTIFPFLFSLESSIVFRCFLTHASF